MTNKLQQHFPTIRAKEEIYQVLANDSTRIADEESLLITDILVELSNGCLADIEVQKIGYLFPGQRAACYGADLLLHQYRRVRSEKKEKFSYKDIKNVYTIVLFETSTKELQRFPDTCLHYFEQKSNTGLALDMPQKYIFLPLDIFKKNLHNKGIHNKLDARLTFLCSDEPEDIITLIEVYPEFKPMYQHIYDMCRNVERVMGLFSEELKIMDRNTVRLMIDQMQEQLEQQNTQLKEKERKLQEKEHQNQELLKEIAILKEQLESPEK